MAEIELKHVCKTYENGFEAVKDFNLKIADKEFIIFVGPSGCGKSTTLRMIAGLEDISGGELYIDGVKMNDVSASDRDIAMVFQNYALYPHLTVKQNILFPLQNLKGKDKLSSSQMDERAQNAARLVQITELMDRRPSELSGGQQQRVAIARAVIANPQLILADEPTGNLDSKNGQEVMELLSELNREGTTIIMVTHSQHDSTYAHRVLHLFDGTLVKDLTNKL